MKIINSTLNGQIFVCPCHNRIHLEFGNIVIQMNYEELESFSEYILKINYKHYLNINRNAPNRRKLLLHLGFKKIHFALTPNEFLELKELLSPKKEVKTFNPIDFLANPIIYN
ncbi:MAG: hypothetical protein GXX85_01670 [Ignavibacteria bacterium]|nr:hypothetical protein [Ignavibacteria bacterium]